jgi:hypothetical protein
MLKIEKVTTSEEAQKIFNRFKLKEITDIEIAKALLKAEVEGMNNPSNCESCKFLSWDGDYGTIQCCDSDLDITDNSKGYEMDNKTYPYGECPGWETNSPTVYCKKHKRWYSSSWELACPECYQEYEKKSKEEWEKSLKQKGKC